MRRHLRILIVDDDDELRGLLRHVLQEEGHTVLDAPDGASALAIARSHAPPQVILSDLRMPIMSGWRLCAELRRDPALAAIPFVVLSGEASVMTRVRSGRPVIQLRKPVDLSTLLSVLCTLDVPAELVSSVRLAPSEPTHRRVGGGHRPSSLHDLLVDPHPVARLRRPVRR
jgi:CheY-like chemotaxis protein